MIFFKLPSSTNNIIKYVLGRGGLRIVYGVLPDLGEKAYGLLMDFYRIWGIGLISGMFGLISGMFGLISGMFLNKSSIEQGMRYSCYPLVVVFNILSWYRFHCRGMTQHLTINYGSVDKIQRIGGLGDVMFPSYPLTSAASTVQPRQPVVGGQIVQSLQHSIADPDALVQEAGEQCLQPRPTVEIAAMGG